MTYLRPAIAVFLLLGLGACSQSFWDRTPRVKGHLQPDAYAATPAPSAWVPSQATAMLPPPQVRTMPSPAATPVPTVSTAPSAAPVCDGSAPTPEEQAVLAHVNQIRRSQGLRALRWNPWLYRAAGEHSREQCCHGYMGHDSPDPARATLVQRMHQAGYQGVMYGEVVAWGYRDPQSVVEGWMNSREHRAILVDRELTEAAFSRVGQYWTGNFGAPMAAPPKQPAPRSTPARSAPSSTQWTPRTSRRLPPPAVRVQQRSPTPSAVPVVPSAARSTPRVQTYFPPPRPVPAPQPMHRPPARGG